ncbi:MAG TPA: 30S ribosomal protein S12 methylthiotransferase RimO [Candidatus Gallibacteroides avistercoris]|uniref:Ribosomal protein uS12 methylthiotransferase RimO n=1 Tax=Candidatus Gallibacteroides avistercoris TaxID=2840833 RepID=A0A9D1SC52_9BACT|nr:30S ribosomal protein S12 methylthiotransferase RimO [Candidatus Gallibacteroides avistercoris]
MVKNRVDIITLGCSKNLVDSERLMRQFKANGYNVFHDAEKVSGEIVVVNTCGFIGDAKEESIEMILDLVEAKKQRKIKKLFVMGCLSERYLQELAGEIPEVDKFYGKFDWQNLLTDLGKVYDEKLSLQRILTTPSHYAYVKIGEGCNRMCSYCAIPIITGRYKSRSIESLEEEVLLLTNQGVKEFQLIAQDLTYYGYDLYKEFRLAELVNRLADIKGVEWIRLHYAYPSQFPFDLLPVMAQRDNVCKYLDIALQHISDPMLQKMRRKVTKQETLDLIARIRQEVPGIHLRTTLMVGHPGEREQDFEELKAFVREARFERMGAFAYSEEEGTYAAKHYKDEIPEEVKQERLDELMAIQEEIAYEINRNKIGQSLRVMIDREDSDYYVGRTQYDSPEVDPEVLVEKRSHLSVGNFYDIQITDAQPFELIGVPKDWQNESL